MILAPNGPISFAIFITPTLYRVVGFAVYRLLLLTSSGLVFCSTTSTRTSLWCMSAVCDVLDFDLTALLILFSLYVTIYVRSILRTTFYRDAFSVTDVRREK